MMNKKIFVIFEFVFFIFLFWRYLNPSLVLSGGDIINQYLPYKHILIKSLKEGYFPLWTSKIFGGYPFFANIQVGLYYPFSYIHLLFPFWGFSINTLFHFLLLFIGIFYFFKSVNDNVFLSHLFAIIFTFSGFTVAHIYPGIVIFLYTITWLVWILFFVNKIKEKNTPFYFVLISLLTYLLCNAGAPQIAVYSLLIIFIYVLLECDNLKKSFLIFYFLFLGILLSSVILYPAYELKSLSFERSHKLTWGYVTDCSFIPRFFILFLFPFFYGNPAQEGFYWGSQWGYWEITPYIGLIPLFMLIFSLKDGWKNKKYLIYLFISFLFYFLSMGKSSYLFYILYKYVPIVGSFRVPGRFLLVAQFFLLLYLIKIYKNKLFIKKIEFFSIIILWSVVACIFLFFYDDILRLAGFPFSSNFQWQKYVIAFSKKNIFLNLIMGFIYIFLIYALYTGPKNKNYIIEILLFSAVLLEMGNFSYHFLNKFESKRAIENSYYSNKLSAGYLKKQMKKTDRFLCLNNIYYWYNSDFFIDLFPNRPIMNDLNDFRGYDPLHLKSFVIYVEKITGKRTKKYSAFLNIESIKNDIKCLDFCVKYILSDRKISLDNYFLEKVLVINAKNKKKPIFFYKAKRKMKYLKPLEPYKVNLQYYVKDGKIYGKVKTKKPFTLILSENYYPGWKIEYKGKVYNGKKIKDTLVAFPMLAGNYSFKIYFLPGSFIVGLSLSLFSMILIICSYIFLQNRKSF